MTSIADAGRIKKLEREVAELTERLAALETWQQASSHAAMMRQYKAKKHKDPTVQAAAEQINADLKAAQNGAADGG